MKPELRVIEGGKKYLVKPMLKSERRDGHELAMLWLIWSLAFTVDALAVWYTLCMRR